MAKIKNFVYCLNTMPDENGASAMGILTAITPDYIPGNFSFGIFFTIVDLTEGVHKLNVRFLNPEGEEVVPALDGEIPYEKRAGEPDGEYSGINIAGNLQNVIFEKSGIYKTVITLDGEEIEEYKILAKSKKELNGCE